VSFFKDKNRVFGPRNRESEGLTVSKQAVHNDQFSTAENFSPNFALVAKPLSDLKKKTAKFVMGPEQMTSFNTLKKMLSQSPVLNIYNQRYETELHTDASIDGFGAVLLQKSPDDGQFHPVYYMSKKTTDAERKFSSYELEILAVLKALEKFRVYLIGIRFKIVTDCNSFVKTLERSVLNTRVARWYITLQDFDYTVEHRSGSSMRHVDALSRYPILIVEEDILLNMKRAQNLDSEITVIKELLKHHPTYDDYVLKNDILYKTVNGQEMLVIPKGMQTEIIRSAHEKGHFAVKKTKEIIGKDYFIPKLEEKIQRFIANCIPCIVSNRKRGKQEGELNPISKDVQPLHTYHVDHLGPLESTSKKYKYIFAVIDSFTKFCWLYPTKTTASNEVIMKLHSQSVTFGNPVQIISDGIVLNGGLPPDRFQTSRN